MSNGILSKIKNMLTEEEDYYDDDDEMEAEVDEREDDLERNDMSTIRTSTSKVVNLHTSNSMKVVIVEPKKYEEVTTIADHLKQKKAVIVNLENLNDLGIRKSIFEFMNGAVYVLDGGIQKVSTSSSSSCSYSSFPSFCCYIVISSFILLNTPSLIPSICITSSMERNAPCSSR